MHLFPAKSSAMGGSSSSRYWADFIIITFGSNFRYAQPYHLLTQENIDLWHQTMKNSILLNNYYLPRELEEKVDAFVDDYNLRRLHESLNNLTPADVYFV